MKLEGPQKPISAITLARTRPEARSFSFLQIEETEALRAVHFPCWFPLMLLRASSPGLS